MTNRIMLCAEAGENAVGIRTVSARMKSPHRFYIGYDEFDRLRQDGWAISSDIHSFVKLRLDQARDRIVFLFTWLAGRGPDHVEGTEQTVTLRWSEFEEFLQNSHRQDGSRTFRALSLDTGRDRPRLVFDGDRKNLKAAAGRRRIRHKLGKALARNFNWPDAEEVRLYNDFTPYSFFFREYRDGHPCLCGGLILHNQENMEKAYYGLHT